MLHGFSGRIFPLAAVQWDGRRGKLPLPPQQTSLALESSG